MSAVSIAADGKDDEDIRLPGGIRVPRGELHFEFSRGGGPGGQNVNKVNTKVTLRFDVRRSPSLTERAREILVDRLASRLTTDGVLVLMSSEHREQARNKVAAIARFRNLLATALTPQRARHATRPTRGSIERKIAARKRRSDVKRLRRPPGAED